MEYLWKKVTNKYKIWISKKVTGKTLDETNNKQNSIKNIDHILEIFTIEKNKKGKLH